MQKDIFEWTSANPTPKAGMNSIQNSNELEWPVSNDFLDLEAQLEQLKALSYEDTGPVFDVIMWKYCLFNSRVYFLLP